MGQDHKRVIRTKCKTLTIVNGWYTRARDEDNSLGRDKNKAKKTGRKRKQKHILRINTWNIRTVLRTGKIREIAKKRKVDIVALQATR